MGEFSKISWTQGTWNPWYGCHKKSPGCAYCYMDRWATRSGRDPEKVIRSKKFDGPRRWKDSKIIFTCSLSDYFIKEADNWRDEADRIIQETPQHTYLILTKEIDRAVKRDWKCPPNARLGVSVENQAMMWRVAEMLHIPAPGYFVSAEPLLSELDFSWSDLLRIRAVIVGGESGGPEYRRLVQRCAVCEGPICPSCEGTGWQPKSNALEWVRLIRNQCLSNGTKFILKQWGGPSPESGGKVLDGKRYEGYPI